MASLADIPAPIISDIDWWEGTTHLRCPCGGWIEWAEAGYVPGSRACRSCLALYSVRGDGSERRLVSQASGDDGIIGDADDETLQDDIYRVPENLYPGWHQPVCEAPTPDIMEHDRDAAK